MSPSGVRRYAVASVAACLRFAFALLARSSPRSIPRRSLALSPRAVSTGTTPTVGARCRFRAGFVSCAPLQFFRTGKPQLSDSEYDALKVRASGRTWQTDLRQCRARQSRHTTAGRKETSCGAPRSGRARGK